MLLVSCPHLHHLPLALEKSSESGRAGMICKLPVYEFPLYDCFRCWDVRPHRCPRISGLRRTCLGGACSPDHTSLAVLPPGAPACCVLPLFPSIYHHQTVGPTKPDWRPSHWEVWRPAAPSRALTDALKEGRREGVRALEQVFCPSRSESRAPAPGLWVHEH